MMSRVEEHISERVPRLPRRLQCPRVITIREHLPSPPELTIDRARDPHAHPLCSTSKRAPILRLDDEMDVITLHRELVHAEPEPPLHRRERLAESSHQPLGAQAR